MNRPAIRLEFAEVHLVDPVKLAEGSTVEAATVMTIGMLLRGARILQMPGTPVQLARIVNDGIVGLAHSARERKQLQNRAEELAISQLYFCSLCGARLRSDRCAGCGRKYARPSTWFNSQQPTLPHKVAVYVQRQGHDFERKR